MNTTRTKKVHRRQQYKTNLVKWCHLVVNLDYPKQFLDTPYRDNKPGVIDAEFLHNTDLSQIRSYWKTAKTMNCNIYVTADIQTWDSEEAGQFYSLKGDLVEIYLPLSVLKKTFNAALKKTQVKMDIKARKRNWFTLGSDFPKFPPKGIPGVTKIQKHLGRDQRSQNEKTKKAIAIKNAIDIKNRWLIAKRRKENLLSESSRVAYKTSHGTYR